MRFQIILAHFFSQIGENVQFSSLTHQRYQETRCWGCCDESHSNSHYLVPLPICLTPLLFPETLPIKWSMHLFSFFPQGFNYQLEKPTISFERGSGTVLFSNDGKDKNPSTIHGVSLSANDKDFVNCNYSKLFLCCWTSRFFFFLNFYFFKLSMHVSLSRHTLKKIEIYIYI